MKLINYANAHMALTVLSKAQLPVSNAYAVYKLRRDIAPKADFFVAREREIISKYGAKRNDGSIDIRDGKVAILGDTEAERADNLAAYNRERDALCNIDENEVLCKPVIRLPADIRITPEMIEAIEAVAVIEVDGDAE